MTFLGIDDAATIEVVALQRFSLIMLVNLTTEAAEGKLLAWHSVPE